MKRLRRCALLASLAIAVCAAQTPPTAKILMLVGGLYHDYDALPKALAANLQTRLKNSVTAEFSISKDLDDLRKQHLSKYDALMINVCEQNQLTAGQKSGLLESVRDGLPLIALHCTFWSFQDWPEFKQILGAFVPGHAHFGPFCLEAASPASPILRGVQPSFELTDEPYIVNDRDPAIDVIVRSCKPIQERPGLEPEVWTKMYSKGRVFAMTSGHDATSQENPDYLKLLSNGILWALGRSN